MARRTVRVPYRKLTPGQLNAVLFAQLMEKKAARGDRFATKFTILASKRQWDALAAMAALFSEGGTSPSTSDFRYAVPRDLLLLSLKICCALLVLIVTAAGALWISEPVDSRPQPAPAVSEKRVRPAPARVVTDLDTLAGLLRVTDPPEARPQTRRAPAIGKKSLGPDHTTAAAKLDDLAGLLRALAIPESERRTGHEALSDDGQEPFEEVGRSGAGTDETEALLEAFPEPVRPPRP